MPFLNFGGNKNKHCNLSDMNFFMKNMKNRYSDPDPDPLWNRIRIHFFQLWIRGSGSRSTITERWIRGSGFTFPKCGSQDPDPDPRRYEMDPKRWSNQNKDILIEVTIKGRREVTLRAGQNILADLQPMLVPRPPLSLMTTSLLSRSLTSSFSVLEGSSA